MSDKNTKEIKFGNKKFGGSYKPGELELNFPDELGREEFEEMFREKIESLHKLGREIIPFDEEIKTKKEKLKPLSIRVKAHTKDFFKNNSILPARDVLELYENYNNGSEAFINSLLKDEEQLKNELSEIQEKLHNAQLFRDKLNELDLEKSPTPDDDKISSLKEEYEKSEVKEVKSSEDIIDDIKLYSTSEVVFDEYYLKIIASNDMIPVIYYFSNDFSDDNLSEVLSDVQKCCKEGKITYNDGSN